ncbi:MAG: hypothetical protein AAGJ86_04615 [Pseudomonadota bacterium]
MKRVLIITIALGAINAHAEEYDWEVGAGFARTTIDSSILILGSDGPLRSLPFENEADAIDVSAQWFLDGLTIVDGPRTEAPFLSRASSLSFAYSRTEFTDVIINTDGSTTSNTEDTDALGIAGRYVWRDSGWFVNGSLGRSDAFGDATVVTLTAGVGLYVAANTTVSATVGLTEIETDFFDDDSSGIIVSVKHIGNFNDQWRYGVAANVSNEEAGDADGQYDIQFSLFPNDEISFRFDTSGPLGSSSFSSQSYGLSGGWFVLPDLEITGGYQWVDQETSEFIETDIDGFCLGVNYRF